MSVVKYYEGRAVSEPFTHMDEVKTVSLLLECFEGDPITRSFFPTDLEYTTNAVIFFEELVERAKKSGHLLVADGCSVVLCATEADPSMNVVDQIVEGDAKLGLLLDWRKKNFVEFGPGIYLEFICVQEEKRGRGAGGHILEEFLEHVATGGRTVYLETCNEMSKNFFFKYGFKEYASIEIAKNLVNYAMIFDRALH